MSDGITATVRGLAAHFDTGEPLLALEFGEVFVEVPVSRETGVAFAARLGQDVRLVLESAEPAKRQPLKVAAAPAPAPLEWRSKLPPASEWLLVSEWAERVKCSDSSAYAWLKAGRIASKKFPRPAEAPGQAKVVTMIPAGQARPKPRSKAKAPTAGVRGSKASPSDRDEWCDELAATLAKARSGGPRIAAGTWRKLLRAIEDCLLPGGAAKALNVTTDEWRTLWSSAEQTHQAGLLELGQRLLDQRGIPELPTPTAEEMLQRGAA